MNPDPMTGLISSFLDIQSRRSQVTAANIANADTPGFTAKTVQFDDFLKQAVQKVNSPNTDLAALIQRTAHGFLEAALPDSVNASELEQIQQGGSANRLTIVEQIGNPVSLDGNTVDVAAEMSNMADVGMKYLFGIQLVQSHLRGLRTAIREGK
jgi:flagellar basal-body rod protein FlgB